jgi:hypothetical protein
MVCSVGHLRVSRRDHNQNGLTFRGVRNKTVMDVLLTSYHHNCESFDSVIPMEKMRQFLPRKRRRRRRDSLILYHIQHQYQNRQPAACAPIHGQRNESTYQKRTKWWWWWWRLHMLLPKEFFLFPRPRRSSCTKISRSSLFI